MSLLKTVRRWSALAGLVLALGACGGGGGGGSTGPSTDPSASGNAPTARILASGDARAAASGAGIAVTVGGLVRLDGGSSSDADKDQLTFEWTLSSRPDGSSATIATPSASQVELRPDRMGVYLLSLKVTDSKGSSNVQQLVITADNREPVASVVVTPSFTATPIDNAAQSVSVGASITLDTSSSTDPDGDAVSASFEWVDKPGGSAATLAVNGRIARFGTDLPGRYKVRVKGSDGRGASFESTYTFDADNRAPMASIASTATFTPVALVLAPQSVTIGAAITLDASGSIDPDGDEVSVSFTLVDKPVASTAQLSVTGKRAGFTADVQGVYRLLARGTDPRGASFESTYVYDASNRAPNPVVVSTVGAVVANAGSSTLSTSVGYDVVLSAAGSSDADGDAITHAWAMTSRPAGSTASLSSSTGVSSGFAPDQLGSYVVTLTTTDSKGAKSVYTSTVQANNRRPVAQISTNASPQALPFAPDIRVPLGSSVTLRGGNSTDPDGDALTYAWSIDSKPSGSMASLTGATTASPTIAPDVDGVYTFRLRVTDPSGAFSERTLTMTVGNAAPTVQLDHSRVTVLTGAPMASTAAQSFDTDGDSLSYHWTLDVRPVGSAAAIGAANQARLDFTPDLPGTYLATVSVSDGRTSSTASVEIRALSSLGSVVDLGFRPDIVKYSGGLDKLVVTSASPLALQLIDPFTGVTTPIPLPRAIKVMNLSPDGKLAVVLYDGQASLIDLVNVTVLNTFSTSGTQTDAMVDNAGVIWVIGTSWDSGVSTYNGRTGAKLAQSSYLSSYYSETHGGVLVDRLHKILSVTWSVTPVDINYLSFDPSTYQVIASGDSPYHGNYLIDAPLVLNEGQTIVFTGYGTYFDTSTLQYLGTLLPGPSVPRSIHHSAALDEVLVVESAVMSGGYISQGLPTYYKRFTGSLFMPQPDLALPLINGQQAYGLYAFHSATGKHVVLVQTGSSDFFDAAASFHVLVR